jgi:serine protein kinase
MDEKTASTFSLLEDLRESQRIRQAERRQTRKVIPLGEYLGLVERGEERFFATAHELMYYAIVSKGVEYLRGDTDSQLARMYGLEGNKVLPIYKSFEEFVGIYDVLNEIVSYFDATDILPETSEEQLEGLMLIGPTGCGKSKLVDCLIRLLEKSGPLWRLYGCPHNDHPLWLLPRHYRPLADDAKEEAACKDLPESIVKIRRRLKELGIRIEFDICPICRERLLKGWPDAKLPDGNPIPWATRGWHGPIPLEEYPVERVEFSKRSNTGYFEVPLTDEGELDIDHLRGRIDMAKIPLYKSETAVGVLTLDGAFNRADQGIIEFPETFKRPRKELKILIGATQDKMVPLPGPHGHTSVNVVIIGHSNWEEYNKFRAKGSRNEALMRRFAVKFFRYNLHLSEEVRLLDSRINVKRCQEIFDIAPHTFEVVAAVAVLSRYKPIAGIPLLQKLEVLDGKRVVDEKGRELRVADVRHPEDGLEEAISFREEMKLFGRLLHELRSRAMALEIRVPARRIPVTPGDAFEFLPQMVEDTCRSQSFSPERRQAMLEGIQFSRERYHQQLLREFRQVLIPTLDVEANEIFLRYMQHCEYWVSWKIKGSKTAEPDEAFLDWIEKNVHGGVRNIREFRKTRLELYLKERQKRGEVTYKDLGEDFQAAFEECAFRELIKRLRVVRSGEVLSAADRKKYEEVVTRLKTLGYSDLTAPRILDYFLDNVLIS